MQSHGQVEQRKVVLAFPSFLLDAGTSRGVLLAVLSHVMYTETGISGYASLEST